MAEYIGHRHEERALTASGDSGTLLINSVGRMRQLVAHLEVAVLVCSGPQITVFIEDSFDEVNWEQIFAFSVASSAPQNEFLPAAEENPRPFSNHIRVRWTMGGTVTDCDFNVNMGFKG